MSARACCAVVFVGLVVLAGTPWAVAADEVTVAGETVAIKEAIADVLGPEELAARRARLARGLEAAIGRRPEAPDTPGDTCPAAVVELPPYPVLSDTTVGAADDYDLPPDVFAPTCTAPTDCTGAGPASSLPRGAIYAGTGRAPDRAFKLRLPCDCTLTLSAAPQASWDLALIVYQAACSNDPADCVCVDDTGVAGQAESVVLNAQANTDYFVLIDGYSTQGTPPAGPYTLTITPGPGCIIICPVELQQLSID
jgi:hypothetical protein